MSLKKISFKIPPGLWSSFKKQTDGLFLSRASFLDHMIAAEVSALKYDLGNRVLSLRAKRHISGELKRQGAKSVNIEVHEETAVAINNVIREHNLVRDAFICRLIIFLRSSDALLRYLEVPLEVGGAPFSDRLEKMPSSPMKALEAVHSDPFFYIRHHIHKNWQCGIYNAPLPKNLDWAACFIEDKDVPKTSAYIEDQRLMTDAFDFFEANALKENHPGNMK